MEALEMVGLGERAYHQPQQLSGGQQQGWPSPAPGEHASIILADEPTGNLDSRTGRDIMGLFTELNERLGRTIIQVTHEADMAAYGKDYHLQGRDDPEGRKDRREMISSGKRRGSLRGSGRQQDAFGLTMLGIIIGVMAVIMMFAVGEGANREISDRFSSMGSNLLTVRPGALQAPGGVRSGSVNTLTVDDARAIAEECSAVAYAAPVYGGGVQVVYGNQNWSTNITGTTPDYLLSRTDHGIGHDLHRPGREERRQGLRRGKTIVDNLAGGPYRETVRVRSVPMAVVSPDEIGTNPGQGPGRRHLVPVTTAQRRLSALPGLVRSRPSW